MLILFAKFSTMMCHCWDIITRKATGRLHNIISNGLKTVLSLQLCFGKVEWWTNYRPWSNQSLQRNFSPYSQPPCLKSYKRRTKIICKVTGVIFSCIGLHSRNDNSSIEVKITYQVSNKWISSITLYVIMYSGYLAAVLVSSGRPASVQLSSNEIISSRSGTYLIALLQQWSPPDLIIRMYPIALPINIEILRHNQMNIIVDQFFNNTQWSVKLHDIMLKKWWS